MLALIVALNTAICPVCGNELSMAFMQGRMTQIHAYEDCIQGDIYSIEVESDTFCSYFADKYVGYLY